MSKNANYRKHNDRTHNSSTYHKKDGTPVRYILKTEAKEEIAEEVSEIERLRGLLREVLSAPYCTDDGVIVPDEVMLKIKEEVRMSKRDEKVEQEEEEEEEDDRLEKQFLDMLKSKEKQKEMGDESN